MKRILVINRFGEALPRNISASNLGFPMRSMFEANLVIVKNETHFKCIKNRWDHAASDEKIPLFLLPAYLNRYVDHFTKEELLETIASA